MQIFYSTDINASTAILRGEEAGHCSRVLRKKEGDNVNVADGAGSLWSGVITGLSKKEVTIGELELIKSHFTHSNLTLAIAPTKNISRTEWFLEKATEIGIKKIVPILSQRSERKIIKTERLNKILLSAMKQSKNLMLPKLEPLITLKQLVNNGEYEKNKFIAHCMHEEPHLAKMYTINKPGIVLIGPEGDFTEDEVKICKNKGWQGVTLGNSRLRTETAALVAVHTVKLMEELK